MFEKVKSVAQVAREKFDTTARRVAVAGSLAGFSGLAAAADGDIDTTSSLAWIAGGLTAALAVSAAMTGAIIAVRGSKLPRRGA